jgi:hypothetical protein
MGHQRSERRSHGGQDAHRTMGSTVTVSVADQGRIREPAAALGQFPRSTGFFVSRVREPGTAEKESFGLGPESDRRMPGTRPSCP